MLPILEVGAPKERPLLGTTPGINIEFSEENTMLVRQKKAKLAKAIDDGVYTVGKSQFKLKKGQSIPARAENVIYRNGDTVVTAHERFTDRISENTSEDEETETTSEDAPEPATTKKATTKKAS